MGISIGPIRTRNRVFLAPMSGVVASEELVNARPDMLRRALGAERISPFVIQLAGREARWMAEGARVAQDMGAEIIDINMGCPARQVTGGLSGSALMRDLDHAMTLIEATVQASSVPVTLKMRLGWDHQSLNAPELARRAEAAGIALVTVHGRTRCQFYGGKADWQAIAKVREAISIPLIANGGGVTPADAKAMLQQSGADGIMIGRGAYGRPWWPGVIANTLDPGSGAEEPRLMDEAAIVIRHHELMLAHDGAHHGNRTARKHIGWTISRLAERGLLSLEEAQHWRASLLRSNDNNTVKQGIRDLFDSALNVAAAA
jgi:tRNA-dihydrouridine synthase B